MARVALFALLLCSLAVAAKPAKKPAPTNNQQVSVMPGGDPPPTCPIRVCKL